jgi:hypothetical protein
MSGATLASYRVVESAEEIELRRRRAAWEGYRAASVELAGLRAQADAFRSAYGDRVARVPAGRRIGANASAGRIERATAEVQALLGQHRRSLQAQVVDAVRQDTGRLLTAAGAASGGTTTSDADASGTGALSGAEQARRRREAAREANERATAREAAERTAAEKLHAAAVRRSEQRRAALVERAATLLTRVPETVDPAVLQTYREAAAEIARTDTENRAILLTEDLSRRIARDNARAETIRRSAGELAALVAGLEVVGGEPAAALRQEIEDLLHQWPERVPEGLAERVAAVVAEADRVRHQKTAAAALRLSLTELGYDIRDGFETVLTGQGSAIAGIPGRQGYGLRVQLDGRRGAVRTEVVRGARMPVDTGADSAAEHKFCDDYQHLMQRLRRHGVLTDQLGLRPPGSEPVQAVADELIPAGRQQAAGQQQAGQNAAYRQMEGA